MELDLLRDLLALMSENDLSEMEVEQEGIRIRLKKAGADIRQEVVLQPAVPAAPAQAGEIEAPSAEQAGLVEITAPMVGTFYRAASPDAEAFVLMDDVVDEETVVCIIEAMKVMNEIKAEKSGRIVEICADNGQAVEYGQVLFRINPTG